MLEFEYYFWSLAVLAFRFITAIILFFVPRSLKQKLIAHQFAGWGIHVIVVGEGDKDDDVKKKKNNVIVGKYDRKKYKCEMMIRDERTFDAIIWESDLGLGESYMKGWWDADDLIQFQQCIVGVKISFWDFPMMILCTKRDLAWNQQLQVKDSKRVIDLHYNLGNDLYQHMLDPGMNYSCGVWRKDTKDLTQAQKNKMDLIARKLKLKPGMKVLDLGVGWGSMAKYLAENYQVSVVGYTLSKEQIDFGREFCKGLDVELRLDDYRNVTGIYDRVYSVGFFEHVGHKNYRDYFSIVRRSLKDDGLHLFQTITCQNRVWPRNHRWFLKYIFPGGELPYPDDLLSYSQGLLETEDMQNIGMSYYHTLKAWEDNFDAAWKDKLEKKYGRMADGQFYRMWKWYLTFSMGCFKAFVTADYQVVQSKNGLPDGYEPEA